MTKVRTILHRFLFTAAVAALLGSTIGPAMAISAEDLNKDANQALQSLDSNNPGANRLYKEARAVLIFPKIIKAGLVFGGAYGEGVLYESGHFTEYYNSVAGSWGWQAGAETYGYVVFLMNDKAVKYLKESKGWEIGTGPSVVVVDSGAAKNLTTSTLKNDAYAFIFDQQGLMASLSIEGTKISRIKR